MLPDPPIFFEKRLLFVFYASQNHKFSYKPEIYDLFFHLSHFIVWYFIIKCNKKLFCATPTRSMRCSLSVTRQMPARASTARHLPGISHKNPEGSAGTAVCGRLLRGSFRVLTGFHSLYSVYSCIHFSRLRIRHAPDLSPLVTAAFHILRPSPARTIHYRSLLPVPRSRYG